MVTAVRSLPDAPPGVSASDIDLQLATRAHSGTSQRPDVRGKQEQEQYVAFIGEVWDGMRRQAGDDPTLQAEGVKAFDEFKDKFLSKKRALLSQRSGLMSTLVTGRSNFPFERQNKKNNKFDKDQNDFSKWAKLQSTRILNAATPLARKRGPIKSGDPTAVDQLQQKIDRAKAFQEVMKSANKIVRSKASDEKKLEQLTAIQGISEANAAKLLKPDFANRKGFPAFETQNNLANIKRMEQRIVGIGRMSASPTMGGEFEGGRIEEDKEDDRLRIFFDDKPDLETRNKLKRNGFRWSPNAGAWQRQLTQAARNSAEQVTGAKLTPEGPESSKSAPAELATQGISLKSTADTKVRNPLDFDPTAGRTKNEALNNALGTKDLKGEALVAALESRGFDGFKEVAPVTSRPIIGSETMATGADPNKSFDFRYKVVELDDLIASHDAGIGVNPAFPKELQPRIRDRQASKQQIARIASDLNPDALLTDIQTLDRGPMIVGPDNVVESGNGRTIALKMAALDFPDSFAVYKKALLEKSKELGFSDTELAQLAKLKEPVLVRERTTEVDRVEFAALSNQATVLAMSPLEQAISDAGRLSNDDLANLTITDNQSIDQALKSQANLSIVRSFMNGLPPNEQAALVSADGSLNQIGLLRAKAAIFSKIFPGKSGQRLTQSFFESIDPTVKNTEAAIFDALPKLAQAEGLVAKGDRVKDLAIGDDLAKVVDVFARLKQENVTIKDYLSQSGLFGRDLTPEQENLLIFFNDAGRSRKRTRELLTTYADAVIESPHPNQGAMFASAQETKGELLGRIIERETGLSKGSASGLFELADARAKQGAFTDGQKLDAARSAADRPQLEGTGTGKPGAGESVRLSSVAARTRKDKVEAEADKLAAASRELKGIVDADPTLTRQSQKFINLDADISRFRASSTGEEAKTLKDAMSSLGSLEREVKQAQKLARPKIITPQIGRGGRVIEQTPLKKEAAVSTVASRAAASRHIPKGLPEHLKPKPESQPVSTKAISQASATERFLNPLAGVKPGRKRRNPVADTRRTAKVVAPANPKTEQGLRQQRTWFNRPSESDFEGVDTFNPATQTSTKLKTRRGLK